MRIRYCDHLFYLAVRFSLHDASLQGNQITCIAIAVDECSSQYSDFTRSVVHVVSNLLLEIVPCLLTQQTRDELYKKSPYKQLHSIQPLWLQIIARALQAQSPGLHNRL
jgi:hypothetical protein